MPTCSYNVISSLDPSTGARPLTSPIQNSTGSETLDFRTPSFQFIKRLLRTVFPNALSLFDTHMKKKFIAIITIQIFFFCHFLTAQPRGTEIYVKDPGTGKDIRLYDGSYALIIGNSEYSQGWRKLPGVKDDIVAVRDVLIKHGFTVEIEENLTDDRFESRIKKFIKSYGYKKDNRLIIYYAGHGDTLSSAGDKRELGYIIPSDTPLKEKDEDGFRGKAISMNTIQNFAKEIQAKHALFIFDSCFSGKLFFVSRSAEKIPPFILDKVRKPIRQFIMAGDATQTVPDNSIFRKAFVIGLEGDADIDRDTYITGRELSMYLERSVGNYSNGQQTPVYATLFDIDLNQGDFVFAVPSFSTTIVDGGVQNGRAAALVNPPYPAEARGSCAAGQVSVQVLIAEDGTVEEAQAISGNPLFYAASVAAARASKFVPADISGRRVKVKGTVLYDFVAENDCTFDAARDFSTTTNPKGPWSYGWLQALPNPDPNSFSLLKHQGTLYSNFDGKTYEGVYQWNFPIPANTPIGNDIYLTVYKNLSNVTEAKLAPGQLAMHPGVGGTYVVVRWTAPKTRTYSINAQFSETSKGTTTKVFVFQNSKLLFTGDVNGNGISAAFNAEVSMEEGNTIDFVVGFGDDKEPWGDETVLDARIVTKSN